MTKGTASHGKKSGKAYLTIRCRRCGKHSYRVRKHKCSYCGYGKSSRLRHYNWAPLRKR